MKTRFFYAPHVFQTWPKLYVLTQDGMLYCEYLNFMKPTKDIKEVDFEDFKAEDYKWSGYQPLEEIDIETAVKKSLTRQSNWVQRYLDNLTVEVEKENKTDINIKKKIKWQQKNL